MSTGCHGHGLRLRLNPSVAVDVHKSHLVCDDVNSRNEDYRCRTREGQWNGWAFSSFDMGSSFLLHFWVRVGGGAGPILTSLCKLDCLAAPVVLFLVADRYGWRRAACVFIRVEALRRLNWRKGAQRFWLIPLMVLPWLHG